jgi:H+-translocating diphosphatase
LILIYKSVNGNGEYYDGTGNQYKKLFEAIAGYGLGGSFVALFGRVGGGIYTKAADVGADLVGKVEKDLPEDSPKNPATIADNVGDNVGDVAGMSADLFGSFAESTCAALVISSDTLMFASPAGCFQYISVLFYPLLLIAVGIIVCLLVSTLSTHIMKVETKNKIESTLKVQLVGSTVILLGITYVVCVFSFPVTSTIINAATLVTFDRWVPYLCSILGLISGMIIAAFTEYVTSHTYAPVRELAQTCKAGAASNVTLGLALGYMSTLVPAIFIAITAFVANDQLGYYGVALSALGMLSNLPLSLAIDGYGPISDNAGGIAEMAEMGEEVRDRTDALDAAGNTTAAIGKGFAIGSAALVSLSLFGGFLHNAGLDLDTQAHNIALTKPEIFAGLLLGAMLPYVFSAFTIRSVGKAAFGMVEEVRRQIHEDPGILAGTSEPDYKACIRISTISSLREMIAPGCLVCYCLFRSSSPLFCSDSPLAPESLPVSCLELS